MKRQWRQWDFEEGQRAAPQEGNSQDKGTEVGWAHPAGFLSSNAEEPSSTSNHPHPKVARCAIIPAPQPLGDPSCFCYILLVKWNIN